MTDLEQAVAALEARGILVRPEDLQALWDQRELLQAGLDRVVRDDVDEDDHG